MTDWIRYADQQPPANTPLLILIDGEVFEGYIDEVMILGQVIPTRFKTVHFPISRNMSKDQHWDWGTDPYWMLCPKKPIQVAPPPFGRDELFSAMEEDQRLAASIKAMKKMTDKELLVVSSSYSQGDIQDHARLILADRNVIYKHDSGAWCYTAAYVEKNPGVRP